MLTGRSVAGADGSGPAGAPSPPREASAAGTATATATARAMPPTTAARRAERRRRPACTAAAMLTRGGRGGSAARPARSRSPALCSLRSAISALLGRQGGHRLLAEQAAQGRQAMGGLALHRAGGDAEDLGH